MSALRVGGESATVRTFPEGVLAKNKGIYRKVKELPAEAEALPRVSSSLSLRPPDFYIPKKLLLHALSSLQGGDLGKFKRKLCTFKASLRISRAQVEAADVSRLRDLLLCNYGWFDALEKTGRALINIGRKRQGERLSLTTEGFWIWNCLGYALESLESDDLERFKEELRRLDLPDSFDGNLKQIEKLPQLYDLLLEECGWFGALSVSSDVLEAINRREEAGWLRLAKRNPGPQNILQYAVETLENGDLQRFRSCLHEFCDQQGSGSVLKDLVKRERLRKIFDALEAIDAGEFSRHLISFCGEVQALEVVAEALEAIKQKHQAVWLRLFMEARDPWKYLEDTLVDLGDKELQELKRCLFPKFSSFSVYKEMLKAADVSELCHLLHKFCGDFVAIDVAGEILEAIGQKHQADWLRLAMVQFSPKKYLDCVLENLEQESSESQLQAHPREKSPDSFFARNVNRTKTVEFFRSIIDFYGQNDAFEVITKVLDAIKEKSQAGWLRIWVEQRDAWKCWEDALSSLGEEDLGRFRCNVLQQSENQGFPPIPKAWMEGTTIPELINVMFSFYGQGAFLEMVGEALKTMAERLSSSTGTDLFQNVVQISGSAAPQLESFVSSGEEMSGKMEKPADLGGKCVCNCVPPTKGCLALQL